MSYISKYTGQQIDEKLDQVSNKVNQSDLNQINEQLSNKLNTSDLLDKVYPVGSIYLAYNHTSPASLFGGTWTRISQKFLWGSSSDGDIGATGGVENHTHTSAAHTHTIAGHTHTSAAHTHNLSSNGWAYITMHGSGHIDHKYSAASGEWGSNFRGVLNEAYGFTHEYCGDATPLGGKTDSTTPGKTGSTSLTTNSTTPGATGSSSNMPPYIQISIWRRTA